MAIGSAKRLYIHCRHDLAKRECLLIYIFLGGGSSMTSLDDELRTLRSALRSLEEKFRRTGGDGYRLQISRMKEIIDERELAGRSKNWPR
jgi:predicted nuclease with TOPRIM domain